ncbi:hypothetical protein BJF85_05220 [Saccharomonospora sp. CUA-673]|uniref:hypothetical protein n=1 Tax=Saccharomonospora sp. CUA-673 TaxID=1904969 RepID=UPI000959A639|nr:hypothetical protein [Saccharomonospora sp. CUA-673]OLT40580.1 hypothetical protein BJF85_05220 [Saccharomonospora sp. CUA-673]
MVHPTKHVQPSRRRNRRAAWTLMLLTLISAEMTFLAVAVPAMWVIFPMLFPMYGAGVLLIRELVVRTGGGWPSLIVMGVVYELVEDGFGLQALTSEVMYNAIHWGPRLFGVNTTYWEVQIGYHVVFSVLIPIAITDLIFSDLRSRPYLKTSGVIITAVTAVVGVALVRVLIAETEDPGHVAPWPFVVTVIALIAVLSFIGLRLLPRRRSATTRPVASGLQVGRVPSPAVAGLGAFAATLAFIGLLMPLNTQDQRPAVGAHEWVWLAMVVAASIAIGALLAIRHWHGLPDWSDTHRIWLIGGALVGHTAFIVVAMILHPADQLTNILAYTLGPAMIVIMIVALAWLDRVVRRRATGEVDRQSPAP